jgi:hypothetical protein
VKLQFTIPETHNAHSIKDPSFAPNLMPSAVFTISAQGNLKLPKLVWLLDQLRRMSDESMGERGADLFDAPDRPTLVELPLFANERRSSAPKNPDVVVSGLLADHRGNYPCEAAEFDVKHIVNRLTRRPPNAKAGFAQGLYGNANQPGLCGWGDEGKLCLTGGRKKI